MIQIKYSRNKVCNPVLLGSDLLHYWEKLELHHKEEELSQELGQLWIFRFLVEANINHRRIVTKDLDCLPRP